MLSRLQRTLVGGSLLALAGAFPSCSVLPGGDDPAPRFAVEDFFDTVAYSSPSLSADGSRVLYSSDVSGVYNVYAQSADGGPPERLTFSKSDACYALGFFPEDDRYLYRADQGGNELDHVYVVEPGEAPVDLTPGDSLKAGFHGFDRSGSAFFVSTNERDARAFDLYRYASGDLARELVFRNTGAFGLGPVSPDGRWMAVTKQHDNQDNDLFLVELGSGEEPRLLTRHEGKVSHAPFDFSPDGGLLYFGSDAGGEFTALWSVDLASGTSQAEFEADWDVVGFGFSDSGRYQVLATNEDGYTVTRITERESGEAVEVPGLARGAQLGGIRFSRDERRMAFSVQTDVAAPDLYVMDLEDGEPVRLTEAMSPALDDSELVSAEVVRYSSFDGLEIPALLYRPKGASADRPAPALVWVHGGPGGQSRAGYSPVRQILVNAGYAVLAVNNRGSSGYGKTFFHLDDLRHGEDDLQDVVFGRRYLESLDWIDGSAVGVIGGSYGGYMVCAALCFEPEAFDVGIDIFGVTNWVRTLESIPPWWEDFREALYAELGDPSVEGVRLRRISPLFHAENIRRPMLVVQGANDPRVLQVESDEMVAAARANGVPVEYLVFPDEGHGFERKENRIAAAKAYVAFLDRHLTRTVSE